MNNLTSEQAKKLGWQCEEEGFIEMVDDFIPDLKAASARGNVRIYPAPQAVSSNRRCQVSRNCFWFLVPLVPIILTQWLNR